MSIVQTWALIAMLGAPSGTGAANGQDLATLLDGVKAIGAPGVPGPLCVFSERAFVVVLGGEAKQQEPVVAAARLGAGRVVAFGHTGYFDGPSLEAADTGRLVTNGIRWAGGARQGKNAGLAVGVHGCPGLLKYLQGQGLKAEAADGAGWAERLKTFEVFCAMPSAFSEEDVKAVAAYVEAGGGLLVADLGWGWLQLHPGKTLDEHPGNQLLGPAGIVWADGYLAHTAAEGYSVQPQPAELSHAGHALAALVAHSDGKVKRPAEEIAQAVWTASRAARSLPPKDQFLRPTLRRLQAEHRAESFPTPQKPITMQQPLARLLLTLDLEEARSLPPEKVRPHPAAAVFPGAVPDAAPRVSRKLEIDTAVPEWHSTGLYAPPGKMILVEVPETAVEKKLSVRIGAHSDGLWDADSWSRCPEICREFAIDQARVRAANAFGGLVYIEVPEGCRLGKLMVTLSDAVEAPRFVLGQTTLSEWREKVRKFPAPWAELETSKIILTVPSSAVRKLEDPEALMHFWDDVADAEADLATIPRQRARAERYVTDQQISAGYMHSGYPIMTFLDVAEVVTDRERMLANGHGGVWGLFHELGHNHQAGEWTFEGTGEVTCNLFTLYVFDKVCGRATNTHESFTRAARNEKLKTYLAGGAKFEQWKADPFLALIMYVQVQEAFGWEAFKKVFAEYRALPAEQRPKNDDEKRDQWLVRLSRTVGHNLGPFFEAWGVPTSAAARRSVAELPAWMPEDWPSK